MENHLCAGQEDADLFLGWQGDAWDAQKDMALELGGAVCAARFYGLLRLILHERGLRPDVEPCVDNAPYRKSALILPQVDLRTSEIMGTERSWWSGPPAGMIAG